MAASFQQTDSTAFVDAISTYGTGLVNANSTNALSSASIGGTAGTSAKLAQVSSGGTSGASSEAAIWYRMVPPAGTSWAAGDWTVPIRVGVGSAGIQLEATHILHISSANAQTAELGTTATTVALGTTGVKTRTITCLAGTPAGSSDAVVIVQEFDSLTPMVAVTATIIADQIIASPFRTSTIVAAGALTLTLLGVGA